MAVPERDRLIAALEAGDYGDVDGVVSILPGPADTITPPALELRPGEPYWQRVAGRRRALRFGVVAYVQRADTAKSLPALEVLAEAAEAAVAAAPGFAPVSFGSVVTTTVAGADLVAGVLEVNVEAFYG